MCTTFFFVISVLVRKDCVSNTSSSWQNVKLRELILREPPSTVLKKYFPILLVSCYSFRIDRSVQSTDSRFAIFQAAFCRYIDHLRSCAFDQNAKLIRDLSQRLDVCYRVHAVVVFFSTTTCCAHTAKPSPVVYLPAFSTKPLSIYFESIRFRWGDFKFRSSPWPINIRLSKLLVANAHRRLLWHLGPSRIERPTGHSFSGFGQCMRYVFGMLKYLAHSVRSNQFRVTRDVQAIKGFY